MKNYQSYLKYLLPIVSLLALNYIYFYPTLQGKVLEQDDIMLGYAKGKQIRDYRAANGEEPLWTDAMFSGMPAFQISTKYPNNWMAYPQQLVSSVGGRSSGVYIIFLLMLGFFILLTGLKVNPWLAAVGAAAFAYSAFFVISLGAGHNAKVRTAAYMAPVILGVILTYRKKYLTGFAITALAVAVSVNSNHFQVTYYLGFLILVIAITEVIFAFKEKALPAFFKASALLVLAAVLGIGPNISKLWSTYEYTKETMRGGSSELSKMKESEGGLTFEYAMNWSYGIPETFNLIIPDFTGGGMAQTYEGTETHNAYYNNVLGSLTSRGTPRKEAEKQANQFFGTMFYWGDQSLVNGGYYLGAVVFFLFVLGFFIVSGRIKWWVAGATVLSLFLAWGKNFETFNRILFDYFPLYSKFRVPSMTFVILFVTVPFFGFYTANKVLNKEIDKKALKKALLNSLYITGGLCLLLALFGTGFFEFIGGRDAQFEQQGIDVDVLRDDRISIMRQSAFRTLLFCVLTFGILWLYNNGKLKSNLLISGFALLVIIDLWGFDKQHVSKDDFVSKREYESNYIASNADRQILQDKDIHYRVWNTNAGLTSDSYTSYYHKSIGGYHGAKLIRYQDLIENQLAKQNQACFDMLNAKWFIVGKGAQLQAQRNPNACGSAWLVNDLTVVANADEEMAALSDFDPRQTAIVDQRYADKIKGVQGTSEASSIRLTSYDPKKLVYEADIKNNDQLAVFSEIYYEGGDEDWKAYIDGEHVPHVRVNYLLRGLKVPAGKHSIEFRFAPKSYYMGESISLIFSILLTLILAGAIYLDQKSKKAVEAEE